MAYNANIDYRALQDALRKQKETETDTVKQAQLQSQIDTAEQSRTEKLASNLMKYGKYADDNELNSAAGFMAENQIGTGYETAKNNLNRQYDNARQNANNDALSRGMARSSFVQDRLSNLDVERSRSLSEIDVSKAKAIETARANILNNYQTNKDNALQNEKKEFASTINAYYNDFQQETDNVRNNNDPSDDWKIPYLQAARNEKILAEQAAALKAAKASYSGGGGGGGGNPKAVKPNLTAAQALEAYNGAGIRTPEVVAAYTYYYGDPNYDPTKTPTYSTPRTATYGSQTVSDVNDMLNNGYTQQEVMAAAAQKYGTGSKEYQSIVSAVLRRR